MTVGIFISSVLWILTVAGFIVWNLYQKNKKMEEIIGSQTYYLQTMKSLTSELDFIVNKMDTTMWVQADPELVQLFEAVKNVNLAIKRFDFSDGVQ
jgi:hypothetical protein